MDKHYVPHSLLFDNNSVIPVEFTRTFTYKILLTRSREGIHSCNHTLSNEFEQRRSPRLPRVAVLGPHGPEFITLSFFSRFGLVAWEITVHCLCNTRFTNDTIHHITRGAQRIYSIEAIDHYALGKSRSKKTMITRKGGPYLSKLPLSYSLPL